MSQMALFLSVKVDVSYKEGADNIDINTETIDGKDTFHSMARAVFQARPSPIDSCMRQVSIKKSNDRTFQMTNDASSQTSCLPFSKPNNLKVIGIKETRYTQSKII